MSSHFVASRDAIAKSLYDRLFRWIVNRVNQLLAPSVEDMAVAKEIGETALCVYMCLYDVLLTLQEFLTSLVLRSLILTALSSSASTWPMSNFSSSSTRCGIFVTS